MGQNACSASGRRPGRRRGGGPAGGAQGRRGEQRPPAARPAAQALHTGRPLLRPRPWRPPALRRWAAPRLRCSQRSCPPCWPASPSRRACAGAPTPPTPVRCAGCWPCTAPPCCPSPTRACWRVRGRLPAGRRVWCRAWCLLLRACSVAGTGAAGCCVLLCGGGAARFRVRARCRLVLPRRPSCIPARVLGRALQATPRGCCATATSQRQRWPPRMHTSRCCSRAASGALPPTQALPCGPAARPAWRAGLSPPAASPCLHPLACTRAAPASASLLTELSTLARLPTPRAFPHLPCSLGLQQRKDAIWREVTAAAEGVGGAGAGGGRRGSRRGAASLLCLGIGFGGEAPSLLGWFEPRACCRPAPTRAGVVPDGTRGDLLEEVANLVESPTLVLGAFDPAFLALPR